MWNHRPTNYSSSPKEALINVEKTRLEDILSGILKFFTSANIRDMEKLTLWVDNYCTAQNKD